MAEQKQSDGSNLDANGMPVETTSPSPEQIAQKLVNTSPTWAGQSVSQVAQLIREASINSAGH